MLAAFKVPERDRFQIVHEHKRSQMVIEDSGLGIERSDKVVVVQVTSRHQHERSEKVALVPSRFVLEFDWLGLRSDEDTWSGSKVNRLIGEFLGQALPSVHFAHGDLT